MNSQGCFDTLCDYSRLHSQAHLCMAPDSQGCFATLRYVCTCTTGAEKRLFTIHNKRAFDGCLCWCPVAPMCLDPMQHSHILDNSYLVIEFHNWCGDAPIYDPQQVEALIYYLYRCTLAPVCRGDLLMSLREKTCVCDPEHGHSQSCFATLRYVCTSTTGAEKRLFTIHNKCSF